MTDCYRNATVGSGKIMSEVLTPAIESQRASSEQRSASMHVRARRVRLFYASGPGDNIGTYRFWKQGHDDPGGPTVPYSGQFYDVCRELDAEAYVLSSCIRRDRLHDGRIRIEHRPYAGRNARGLLFHLAQLWYGVRLLITAARFRPDVAIINEGVHWFMLSLMSWAGVRVVPSLHCKLEWPGRTGAAWSFIRRANRRFFSRYCSAVMAASKEIADQVAELTGPSHPLLLEFMPLYRRETFANIKPADGGGRPFNVLFVGRIEANKGIFDFLEVARRICRQTDDMEFHVCGVGSALPELQSRLADDDLGGRFHLHGYCDRARLSELYSLAHVVMVPTRSDCGEGFNQVVAEAVLAGRPVITSSICPAVAYVRDAAVMVTPDDVDGYTGAVLRLASDAAFYRGKQQACETAQSQFYDRDRGWGAVVRQIVQTAGCKKTPTPQPIEATGLVE